MTVPERLYLAYTTEQPPLSEYDVKRRTEKRFFGCKFTFAVIGDSHYIGAPKLGFHELFSCKPIRQGRVTTVKLPAESRPPENHVQSESRQSADCSPHSDGHEVHSGRYRFGATGVTTTIRCEPISTFPGPEPFDIAYRFGREAYTTINCRSATTYETHHTYPEYDLTLYSEHEFTDLSATPADSIPKYEIPGTKAKHRHHTMSDNPVFRPR